MNVASRIASLKDASRGGGGMEGMAEGGMAMCDGSERDEGMAGVDVALVGRRLAVLMLLM